MRWPIRSIGTICLMVLVLSSGPALSAKQSDEERIFAGLSSADLRGSLTTVIKKKTSSPRYFEAKCAAARSDNSLYPGIPYKECTYVEQGLPGWVQLVVIPPEKLATWIVSACDGTSDARRCVARLAAYMWASNQFSYPIAGNIVEPADSAGGKGAQGLNLIFLHGITIPNPREIPSRTAVPAAKQREIIAPLALGSDVALPAQVSRPAGIRREIYLKFGTQLQATDGKPFDIGKSCPASDRKAGWLQVSRISLVNAWNAQHHALIDAAAKALEKGIYPGRIDCKDAKK